MIELGSMAGVSVPRRSVPSPAYLLGLVLLVLAAPPQPLSAQGPSFGVFVRLATGIRDRGFDEVLGGLRRGVEAGGWTVLGDHASGVDSSKCSFRAHVLVVHSPGYAGTVLEKNLTGAFALPLRLAVYQDEQGIHISATNPQSLNRTMVSDLGFETESADAVAALKQIVAREFAPYLDERQHGQLRTKGLIDKTMGIIAGGPFAGKLETVVSLPGSTPEALTAAADRIAQGLQRLGGRRRWQIRPIYRLDLPERGAVILGVTGAPMEAKAFSIVHHGDDDSRKSLACPGIDHAAAFPIEIVLTREENQIRVRLVDAMFRMKIYFEDAGRMKFAANMAMPGSIESELRDLVEESLGI